MTGNLFLCTISPQYHTLRSQVTRIRENDHQKKKLLILKQILLVSSLGCIYRTVVRIWILMFGCKGLSNLRTIKKKKKTQTKVDVFCYVHTNHLSLPQFFSCPHCLIHCILAVDHKLYNYKTPSCQCLLEEKLFTS